MRVRTPQHHSAGLAGGDSACCPIEIVMVAYLAADLALAGGGIPCTFSGLVLMVAFCVAEFALAGGGVPYIYHAIMRTSIITVRADCVASIASVQICVPAAMVAYSAAVFAYAVLISANNDIILATNTYLV